MGSTVASQLEAPWFESRLSQDAFLCGVMYSSGCSCFPHNPKKCRIGELDKINWLWWVNEWVCPSTGVSQVPALSGLGGREGRKGIRCKNVAMKGASGVKKFILLKDRLWRPLIKREQAKERASEREAYTVKLFKIRPTCIKKINRVNFDFTLCSWKKASEVPRL